MDAFIRMALPARDVSARQCIVAAFIETYCFVFVVEYKLTTLTVCAVMVCSATPAQHSGASCMVQSSPCQTRRTVGSVIHHVIASWKPLRPSPLQVYQMICL